MIKRLLKVKKAKSGIVVINSGIELEIFSNATGDGIYISPKVYPMYFLFNEEKGKFEKTKEEDALKYRDLYEMKDLIHQKRRRKMISLVKEEIADSVRFQTVMKDSFNYGIRSTKLRAMNQSHLAKISDYISNLLASLSFLTFNEKDTHGKKLWDTVNFLNKNFKG